MHSTCKKKKGLCYAYVSLCACPSLFKLKATLHTVCLQMRVCVLLMECGVQCLIKNRASVCLRVTSIY